MKGAIRVYCRVRPFSRTETEDESKHKMCMDINDQMSVTVHGRVENNYNFNSVFAADSTQIQVFDETKRLIQSAIDGYNVCIFAYGQTGSGKTFTIQVTDQHPGLTPRSIAELGRLIHGMKIYTVNLSCYMVEIYKGELRDLLLPKNVAERPKIEVRFNKEEGFTTLKNVKIKEIKNMEQLRDVFEKGLTGRKTRKTQMNDESSRSHLIFSILIESENKITGKKQKGKLTFVDLAGSENSKKTGTDKEGQAEANEINKSLSALGLVINKLVDGSTVIPYRENILTRVMQDSIGGNAKTLMFVNCSPSVYNRDETKNSLEYAKRVKQITNNPLLNLESKALQRAKNQVKFQHEMLEGLKHLIQESNKAAEMGAIIKKIEEE